MTIMIHNDGNNILLTSEPVGGLLLPIESLLLPIVTIITICYGRFPKFHRVFLGRDPGTLKSDIVSKKHPQLICSDLRLSN